MPPAVHAIGNAIVDLQVRVEDALLERLGAAKGSMALVDGGRQEAILAALDTHPVSRCSGGSAANTVAGIAELGGEAGYCCKVGTDALGAFYLDDLRAVGVKVEAAHGLGDTGTCVVLVTPDAQRTMFTCLGVSAELCADDVVAETLEGGQYLYVEGHLLAARPTTEAALAAIVAAKTGGLKVALTVSDPFVIDMRRDLFWELIRGPVDLLFCNEQEARALTGLHDPLDCAREIHQHAANVALTLGAKGSLLMHEQQVYPIEGVPAAAVDTTGAGDMYAAGILHGLTSGLDWPTAGHLASHAAARVVEQLGARLPRKFTPAEMQRLCRRD
jgi:hypothetical protein